MQRASTNWFVWLICLLALVSAIAVVGIFVSAKYHVAHRNLGETSSRAALSQVGGALREYTEQNDGLLPASTEITANHVTAWRVVVESNFRKSYGIDFGYAFDQEWNSYENTEVKLAGSQIPYCWNMGNRPFTRFVAVTGPETAFPGTGPVNLASIKDGAQNTVLLVEWSNSTIEWTEPKDMPLTEVATDLMYDEYARPAVLFADFEVFRIGKPMPEKHLIALFTIDGSDGVERDELVHDGTLIPGA